jgi:PAS domain S-box-containing protein
MFNSLAKPEVSPETEASKLILNSISEAYVFLDTDLKVTYFNKAALEQTKTYYGREIYIGLPIIELVHESRKDLLSRVYQEALAGKRYVSENEHLLADGSKIYFENTFQPAYNEKKEVVGAIISSRNITDKKRSQQTLQESEERLQFALEAANQVAWDWNLQTNEVIYSGSYKKLYGFSEQDSKNDFSDWVSRIHPEDRAKMQDLVLSHIDSRSLDHDSQYRIRDGEGRYRWIMAKGRLVSFDDDGKPLRMIGTHTDITDAVNRELELKQINERFNCMMKATHELLWEWDVVNNKIFRSKDGVRNELELADGSPIERMEQLLHRVHPDDLENVHAILNKVLKAPHGFTFELEYRFRRHGGDYAYVYDRAILLRDEHGEPVRVIGSAQNISERKRLEKELLNNELEYQRLLHQATVESQEKERAEIGKELHDNINQVLTTTKLYLELVRSNEEMKEDLIARSLTNINNIIQEIRLLSRSLMDPSIGDLGLTDTIRDLIENIHLTQKIKVEFCTDENIEAHLDSQQKLTVFRIIQECMSNVLRHASATFLRIEIKTQGDQASLQISDNGVGFLPESIRKGAGLKNIQNRIYLINGTLQLESSPGKGCTITLQFPIALTR